MALRPGSEIPPQSEKTLQRIRLESKGVDKETAAWLTGEDEPITREDIRDRRIAWQRTLKTVR